MVNNVTIFRDGRFLSLCDSRVYIVEQSLALVSGFAIFGLIILAVMSVLSRKVFGQPIPGYMDWIEQIMPLITFIGISYTQRNGGHIRMDMFINKFRKRPLYIIELITTIIILGLILLMLWGASAHFLRSFDFGLPLWSRDSSMDIGLPIWPAKLIVPIAFFILTLRILLQIWGYLSAVISNTDAPIAVPVNEEITKQAISQVVDSKDFKGDRYDSY